MSQRDLDDLEIDEDWYLDQLGVLATRVMHREPNLTHFPLQVRQRRVRLLNEPIWHHERLVIGGRIIVWVIGPRVQGGAQTRPWIAAAATQLQGVPTYAAASHWSAGSSSSMARGPFRILK